VLAEIHRVLKPGGYLILSVPHTGLLASLDPLNVYPRLARTRPSWLPLEPADESGSGFHRHFSNGDMGRMLASQGFRIDRFTRTGLGLSEVFHLASLLVFKAALRWQRAYLFTRPVHFLIYIVDDLIPTGPLGYHLTMRARREESWKPMTPAGSAHIAAGQPGTIH
jgi:SAM-dependent methyltransferase